MKKTNSKYLWLLVSDNALTAARFKGSNGNTKITFINSIPLQTGVFNPDGSCNIDMLQNELKRLLTGQKIKHAKTILLLAEKHIFHHRIELAENKKVEIEQILAMAQELFPIDLSTTYYDAYVNKTHVEFVASTKSIVDIYLKALKALKVEVVQVDAAREFIEIKSSPTNLLKEEINQARRQEKNMPRLALLIILVFGYLTYNLLTASVRWSTDYSGYIESQENLLGVQNIVDTVYNKDIALSHFEKIQLNEQIERIINNRLAVNAFIEATEEIVEEFVEIQELKVLQKISNQLPTVKIAAISSNRDMTEAFSSALEESPLFDEVDLPLSFFSKRGEALIEATLTLNEEAYKQLQTESVKKKPSVPPASRKNVF